MSGTILFVIIGIIFLLWLVLKRPAGTSIPQYADKTAYGLFIAELPPEFGYHYFFDNTGYAINMNEKSFIVRWRNMTKRYPITELREIKKNWVTAEKTVILGKNDFGTAVGVSNLNAKRERDAYDESGLFLHVADINTPILHIKFSDKALLDRSYEIFLQAMEGRLPQEKNETTPGVTDADLRMARKAQGLCTVCGQPLVSDKDKLIGYCRSCAKQ